MKIDFSKHSLARMECRCITKEKVLAVLEQPDSIVKHDEGITIFSKI